MLNEFAVGYLGSYVQTWRVLPHKEKQLEVGCVMMNSDLALRRCRTTQRSLGNLRAKRDSNWPYLSSSCEINGFSVALLPPGWICELMAELAWLVKRLAEVCAVVSGAKAAARAASAPSARCYTLRGALVVFRCFMYCWILWGCCGVAKESASYP